MSKRSMIDIDIEKKGALMAKGYYMTNTIEWLIDYFLEHEAELKGLLPSNCIRFV